MNPIISYTLTYAILLVLFLGLVQFLTNGFFFKFIKVKGSRGKKLMVEVRSKLQTYVVIGTIKEGFLVYKDFSDTKKEKKIKLENNAVFRKFNVNCVMVDEENNFIIMPDGTGVAGFDALKFESLHIRALMSKETTDLNKFIMILIGLGVVTLIAVLILFARIQEINKIVEAGIQVTGVV